MHYWLYGKTGKTKSIQQEIELVFQVQKQSFADVTFSRTTLVTASENLRNVFAQKKFSLQLKLCLNHIYFHSYSFAPDMTKMSSNIFLMFHFKEYYRKKCIMRNFS